MRLVSSRRDQLWRRAAVKSSASLATPARNQLPPGRNAPTPCQRNASSATHRRGDCPLSMNPLSVRGPMNHISFAILLSVALFLAGCSGQSRFKSPLVNIVENSASYDGSSPMVSVAAQCPVGQPLLGGGYLVFEAHPNSVVVLGSFPSVQKVGIPGHAAINEWVGQFRPLAPGNGAVLVVAYCYARQATSPTTVTISTNTQPVSGTRASVTAACPTGAALTGGGFQNLQPDFAVAQATNESTLDSFPTTIPGAPTTRYQWEVELGSFVVPHKWNYAVYAVCATGHLKPNSIQSQTFSPPNPAALQAGDILASCQGTSFTTNIGYVLDSSQLQLPRTVNELDVVADFAQAHVSFDSQSVTTPPQSKTSCVVFVD